MVIISLVVFIGNILVIRIVYRILSFRISINYYYVNMVVFDLLLCFIIWLLYFIDEIIIYNGSFF